MKHAIHLSLSKCCIVFLSLAFSTLPARDTIRGDAQTRDGKTFSFPIHAYHVSANKRLYVGAAQAGTGKEFALSYLLPGNNEFQRFAREKISIDTIADQNNPLFDAKILHINEIDATDLCVVVDASPEALHVVNFSTNTGEIFSLANLHDASMQEKNSGIVALAGNNASVAFAAVKGHEQKHFGSGSSGIAIAAFRSEVKKIEISDAQMEEIKKKLAGATPEEIEFAQKGITIDKDGKRTKEIIVKTFSQLGCVPFSLASDFLKIGNDLVHIDDVVDMYWSSTVERLYVAVRVKGGSDAHDGVRALAVGNFDKTTGALVFYPIVADALVQPEHNIIVGGRGSDTQIAINKVRTMQTTTGFLDYLIVQGGNGAFEQAQRTVFALPLLNFKDELGIIDAKHIGVHGTLATIAEKKVDGATQAITLNGFRSSTKSHAFLGRHFCCIPQSPNDLITAHADEARVGAGPLHAGAISDLMVKDDAVYAVVAEADRSYASGVYRSQAIFDYDGHIAAWTRWEKIIDTDDVMHAVLLDSSKGNHLIINGSSSDAIKNVERMDWALQTSPLGELAALVTEQLPPKIGGIQELIDFSPLTPGLSDTSLLCATGLSKIVLVCMSNNAQTPALVTFKNGEIEHAVGQYTALAMEGGAVARLGPICAAEIGVNDTNGWLFIGGVHGVAVLCHADGSGWAMPQGLHTLDALQQGMAFKRIGNYAFVRKIICDDQYLYVLTDTVLDRIDLRTASFADESFTVTRLANARELTHGDFGICQDMVVSEKLCVLAHTNGLCRVGNGKDIRTDDVATLDWTLIEIPGAAGAVTSLVPISVTGRSQDLARFNAGQLYIVTGTIGKNNARLHRLVIHNLTNAAITDTSVQQLHDYVSKDQLSSFANLGTYSSCFATDGSMFFTAINKKQSKAPAVLTGFGKAKTALPLKLQNASQIVRIIRSSACGNWLIAGDFGLLVNE